MAARIDLSCTPCSPSKHPPLIPEALRFGLTERIRHDGSFFISLGKEEVLAVLARIKDTQIQSIAVCLLQSYVNPIHEQLIGALAREKGFTVSLSCEVLPEFREFERVSTVAANAALRPVMGGYLERLETGAGHSRLNIMQSAGGVIPANIARRLPVHTVLSGRARGVVAAAEVAKLCGVEKFISFDMGGTSTDVSLFDRALTLTSEKVVAGHPIRVPVIDIHTVAVGGGSIARRDVGGSLKVGPVRRVQTLVRSATGKVQSLRLRTQIFI